MRTTIASLALALLATGRPAAASAEDAGVAFFETKVRPVLVRHCYKCHSAQAGKHKGGLLLDSRAGLRKGGDSGPAVVPGRPGDSLLIRAVRHAGDTAKMPPKGKLSGAVLADLEAWVKMGAPDPRDRPTQRATAVTWAETLRTRRRWWSLRPVRKPSVPGVRDRAWPDDPVD